KQNGAQALDTSDPLAALNQAAATLGLQPKAGETAAALQAWVNEWKAAMLHPAPESPGHAGQP
ncbi:MAG: hypothetical protein ABI845_05260, partial [Polaromonas sp.]